jgi:hypothetical protein
VPGAGGCQGHGVVGWVAMRVGEWQGVGQDEKGLKLSRQTETRIPAN